MTTLAYALQRAGAQLLELDSRELGVLTVPAGEKGNGLGVVIYDNVPDGAGHVQELLFRGEEWLKLARQVLFVNPAHDARCDTACLECLLSFDGQDAASRNLFNRRLALRVLAFLLDEQALPPREDDPGESEVEVAAAVETNGRSREDRKKAAQERLRRRS